MSPVKRNQRYDPTRSSTMLWTAAVALLVVIFLILGLSASAPPQFFSRAAIGIALVLLALRQVSRRFRNRTPRAAQPDPKSTLNLS